MRRCACLLIIAGALLAGCGTAPRPNVDPLEVKAAEARLMAQLAPRLDQSAEGLTPVARKDGGRSLRMNGRFSQAQIARLRSDGTLVTTCVDTIEGAKVALRGAAE